ncbi:MAG: tetratricopeptide repeat protein [Candidatus Caenarcaniphilales bacterium]|nr:tetratricopeptide repeat protein [Candidatus Caenarcaniphilales bacterium]
MSSRKKIFFIFIALNLLIFSYTSAKAYKYQFNESDKKSEVSRLINQGMKYYSSRNYDLSIKSFSEAYALDKSNPDILNNLSIVHNNYGSYLSERTDPTGALREFRLALFYDETNQIARKNLETQLKHKKVDPKDVYQRIAEAKDERGRSNFLAAIAELQEANKIKPTTKSYVTIAKIYHVLALRSLDNKVAYMARALKNLDTAQKIDPNNPEPLVAKGDIYVAKGKISRGIDFYKQAVEMDPTNGESQQALINGWLAAIRVAPGIANNFVGLATAYQLNGNMDQAEKNFRRAMQLDPNNLLASEGINAIENDRVKMQLDLFLNRAISLQKDERFDESIDNYIKAVRLSPRNPDIHYNIGTCFQAKKDWFQAEKAYRKALDLNPEHEEAGLALKKLTDDRRETQIAEAFDKAVELHKNKQYNEAIQIYLKVSRDKPSDDTLFYNIGTAYQALGNFDEAKKYYEKASVIKADDEVYKQAINTVNLKHADDLLAQGINAQTEGKQDIAAKKYQELLEITPDNSDAWYNLGIAYQSLAKPDEALRAYKKAFEIAPLEQSDAIFFAALILEDKKNLSEAMKLYEKYIEVAPEGDYYIDVRDRLEYIKSQS